MMRENVHYTGNDGLEQKHSEDEFFSERQTERYTERLANGGRLSWI